MQNLIRISFLIVLFSFSCTNDNEIPLAVYKSDKLAVTISKSGRIIELKDLQSGKNYHSKDSSSVLLSLRVRGDWKAPQSASIAESLITLQFEKDVEAKITVEEKESYIAFELVGLTNHDSVDLILWGPFQTTINKIIGETVGVVRGEEYAIGIQSLNIKTLGGYPWNESDRMPAFDIFRQEDIEDMHPEQEGSVLYRVEAAKPTKYGSSLQAYCRNRINGRIVDEFDHEKIAVPAYDDGGVLGSRIALFGCPVELSLQHIGEIELAEGLPHPMIDGEWIKTSPLASSAYLITSFTEENVEKAISITKRAGLKYLYHYGKTFESWGHFELYKGEFPSGISGLKKCVELAEEQGIKLGTHCLSNFITTDDPYVTPIPDKRLAKVGSSILTESIDPGNKEIFIESPTFFNQMKNNNLKTVMIGEELIRYGRVSKEEPWKLLDCQRGSFNTKASGHESGEEISKLLDHGYKVFLSNADLTVELSERLADIYNQTGLRQISFDGLEGNRSTGLGTYGESLMPYTWYNSLNDELKNHLIIDASRTTHFFWHIYSRMNWGEPWYAGFRESQTEYRFNNQPYFKRNFMPGMLGWFKMTPETSLEDIEWMLARSAGYEAGYALVADMESIEENGNTSLILERVGDWEKLRISDSFTEDQKEMMRDNSREFTIERSGTNKWIWQEVRSEKFAHEKKVRQPGEPLSSTSSFNYDEDVESLCLLITAVGADVSDLSMELNSYKRIDLPFPLEEGESIRYTPGEKAILYDSKWQKLNQTDLEAADLQLDQGENQLSIECEFDNSDEGSKLKIEIRMKVEGSEVELHL